MGVVFFCCFCCWCLSYGGAESSVCPRQKIVAGRTAEGLRVLADDMRPNMHHMDTQQDLRGTLIAVFLLFVLNLPRET